MWEQLTTNEDKLQKQWSTDRYLLEYIEVSVCVNTYERIMTYNLKNWVAQKISIQINDITYSLSDVKNM